MSRMQEIENFMSQLDVVANRIHDIGFVIEGVELNVEDRRQLEQSLAHLMSSMSALLDQSMPKLYGLVPRRNVEAILTELGIDPARLDAVAPDITRH
jgi:hypothetical protein